MPKRIHICILTSAHPIDDVRVNHKLVQAFRANGFRVTWIGPNYTFFDSEGYNKYDIQYRLFPSRKGKRGRILNIFKLMWHAFQVSEVDVFYLPDPDAAVMATLFLRNSKARIIFDIHEIYHGVMLDRWVKGALKKIASKILLRQLSSTCSKCDLIIGVGETYLEPYMEVKNEKMVVRSCAPSWFAQEPPSDVCGINRNTFTFFHGKANSNRGTGVVLKALELTKQHFPNIKCIMFDSFYGSMHELAEFQQQIANLNLYDVVDLRSCIPMEEMPTVLGSCDTGLIAYGRDFGIESLPNRFFEYMAAGLPIIVPDYAVEMRPIVESELCGLSVDYENPESVSNAMIWLCKNPERTREMGLRGRIAFNERHNWETEVEPLLNHIESWFVKA